MYKVMTDWAYHIDEDDVIMVADGKVRGASKFVESRNRLFRGALAHRKPPTCYEVGRGGVASSGGVGIKMIGELLGLIEKSGECYFILWLIRLAERMQDNRDIPFHLVTEACSS